MIIVYEGDNEVWICEKEQEINLLKNYFGEENGRNIKHYVRGESTGEGIICISTKPSLLQVNGDIYFDEEDDIENENDTIPRT